MTRAVLLRAGARARWLLTGHTDVSVGSVPRATRLDEGAPVADEVDGNGNGEDTLESDLDD